MLLKNNERFSIFAKNMDAFDYVDFQFKLLFLSTER